MPIYDYNLSASDVLEVIGSVDTRRIQQSSGRVSKDDIDNWISDIASEFSGALEKSGIDGADLSDEAEAQIQRGIVAGAAAQTLQAYGHTGDQYREFKSTYQDLLARYEEDVQRLDRTTSRYDSNADTTVDDSPYKGVDWEM